MATVIDNIKIEQLHPHPDNPRKDVGDVTELAESIKVNGIMQNLTVIPMFKSDHDFIVLIGHRRLAAAKKAGVETVPCKIIVDDIPSREEQISIMLEENMQRRDLTVWEQATSFKQVVDLGGSVNTLREKTGFSENTIRNRIKVAELDEDLVRAHTEGADTWQITFQDMIELSKIDDVEKRNSILKNGYSRDNFRYNVQAEIKKQDIEKTLQPFYERMADINIPEGKKNIYSYTPGYEVIARFYYTDKKLLTYTPNSEEFWVLRDGYVLFMRKEVKKEIDLAADREKKAKEQEERRQLDAFNFRCDDIKYSIYNCIEMTLEGKLKIDSNKLRFDKLISEIWEVIHDCNSTVGIHYSNWILCGRQTWWEVKPEAKAFMLNKYKKLPVELQMLSQLGWITKNLGYPYRYGRVFDKEVADKYLMIINILYYAGYKIKDDDVKILCGTDEFYKKG